MTGPEHYREAERLLAPFYTQPGNMPMGPSSGQVSQAQAHATLALAAATALRQVDGALPQPDYRAWYDTAVTRQEVAGG